MNKNFINTTNEQLCAILARLKSQLIEARFKMSSGELEKLNVISQIKRTIARILTELTQRGFKASVCSYGVVLYDLKNKKNKPTIVSQKNFAKILTTIDKANNTNSIKKPSKINIEKNK